MNDEFAKRIKSIRKSLKLTQKEFADKLNTHSQTISRYEKGKLTPSVDFLFSLTDKLKVNPTWLLTGKGKMFFDDNYNFPEEALQKKESENNDLKDNFSLIPMVEARLSAGGGSFITSDNVENYYAFRNDWLTKMKIKPEKAFLMKVIGDSMADLINDGDVVLIDTLDKYFYEGKIYAIAFDDTIFIKKIFRDIDKIILKSENQNYSDIVIDKSEIDKLNIIGRIKWIAKVI